MIELKLSKAADILQGSLEGEDKNFRGVSIDSRTITEGELFIAIKGPHFNGHDYIESALRKGAAGVLVSEPVSLPADGALQGSLLRVPDTRLALGQLATWHRQQFNRPLFAVTGSCGKTTTKTMIASILSLCGHVHANPGTLNNDYGVPLTVLDISPDHDYAVIEMGANHLHEIAYLTHIAKPTVALITLAAPVHIEGFGSLGGVAKGKGEIFEGLDEEGIAIINADDQFCGQWKTMAGKRRVVTFGLSPEADIRALEVSMDKNACPNFILQTPGGSRSVCLPLLGEYNVVNALASAAAAWSIGISLENIVQGLEAVTPVAKRMVRRVGVQGIEIFDDTYNANPFAAEAALKVLAAAAGSSGVGEKVFVLGEMGELGASGEEYHRKLGEKALEYGVTRLYATGELAKYTVEAFGQQGFHFADQADLIAQLRQNLNPGMCVLVKGSRSTQMERVVEALMIKDEENPCFSG